MASIAVDGDRRLGGSYKTASLPPHVRFSRFTTRCDRPGAPLAPWCDLHEHRTRRDERPTSALYISANSSTAGQPVDPLCRSSRIGDEPGNWSPITVF